MVAARTSTRRKETTDFDREVIAFHVKNTQITLDPHAALVWPENELAALS
jgi:hypothetical protein